MCGSGVKQRVAGSRRIPEFVVLSLGIASYHSERLAAREDYLASWRSFKLQESPLLKPVRLFLQYLVGVVLFLELEFFVFVGDVFVIAAQGFKSEHVEFGFAGQVLFVRIQSVQWIETFHLMVLFRRLERLVELSIELCAGRVVVRLWGIVFGSQVRFIEIQLILAPRGLGLLICRRLQQCGESPGGYRAMVFRGLNH